VVDGARERREAIRQLAELRRRLTAAEDALTEAHAAMKRELTSTAPRWGESVRPAERGS
jgi:hypothetical protein